MSQREKQYVYSYKYKGSSWEFVLSANDQNEAQEHLSALLMTAQLDGELVASVPLWKFYLVPFYIWFKDLFK